MARRGVMTALQAALAGIGGAAGGYVQMEDRKRKQLAEQQATEAQDFARQLSMVQSGVRQVAPGASPQAGYASLGSFRGAQYEVPTPEKVAADAAAAKLASTKAETDTRVKAVTDVLNRPEFSSISQGAKSAIIAGASGIPGMPTLESTLKEQSGKEMTPYQRAQLAIDNRRLAIQENAAKTQATEADWRRTRLPPAANAKLAGYESGVLMVADVRNQLEANPDAVGMKNMAWNQIVNRLDPTGVGVRASVEALSGEIRNQRFGGALTANEAKFAEQFLPSATDRADVAMTKLQRLESYLELKRKGIYSVYGGQYSSLTGGSAADQLKAAATGR